MTTEEKAKFYDEAEEWMRSVYPTMTGSIKEDAVHYFPSLKESEDERIIRLLRELGSLDAVKELYEEFNLSYTDVLYWLEKQKEQKSYSLIYDKDLDKAAREYYLSGGADSPIDSTGLVPIVRMAEFGATWMKERMQKEQKPAEWSENNREEDIQTRFAFYTYKDDPSVLYLSNVFVEETSRNHGFGTRILKAAEKVAEAIGAITICLKVKQDSPANAWYRKRGYGYVTFEDEYDWLEKKLEYMKPTNQEWSDKDENYYDTIVRKLQVIGDDSGLTTNQIDFLDKHRPQPRWKPSEEQMEALKFAIDKWENGQGVACPSSFKYNLITKLYNDLKQL